LEKDSKIYVAGGETLIGSAIIGGLKHRSTPTSFFPPKESPSSPTVYRWIISSRYAPQYIYLAGGKSGGIRANENYPAELMGHNLLIQCHVLESALQHG